MSKNYELVALILEDPGKVALWFHDKKIAQGDIKIALDYIQEQKLLSEEKLIEKAEFLANTLRLISGLLGAKASGMSYKEIKKLLSVGKQDE